MCKETFTISLITPETPDKEKKEVEAIFNEAFPATERPCTFDELLARGAKDGILKTVAVYSGDVLIGFLSFGELSDFVYLLYFAVNSKLRGKGYGTKLIPAILDAFPGKECIGSIEAPFPGTSNYEQREKRRKFYERNKLYMSKFYTGKGDEESMFNIITSRPEITNSRDAASIKKMMEEVIRFLPMTGPLPEGHNLFVYENGRVEKYPMT